MLWVGRSVGERLAAELVGSGDELVGQATTEVEVTALIAAAGVDIAVINADPAHLTPGLIDACDVAGVRLIVIIHADSDRRHALSLDFHETCRSDASWESMVELLRPPSFGGESIPDLAFFDITSDAVPTPLPPVAYCPSEDSSSGGSSSEDSSSEDSPPLDVAPGETRATPVIAVWGPTGAPGRTSVAINVAAELSQEGLTVLLIDADSYGGTIAPKLGLLDETPGFAAVCRLADQELLTHHELQRLAQIVDIGGANRTPLWVLTGILRPDRWPELSAVRVARVLEFCRGKFDIIIIDVGFNVERDEEISSDLFAPRRNAATLTVLGEADTIVAVADSDVVGLARFLRASADVRELFVGTPIIATANRVRSAAAGLAPRAHIRQTLERFGGLTDIMVFPCDDRAFDACVLRSAPLCTVAPKSAVRIAIRELALRLALDCSPPSQAPSRGTRGFRSTLFARRRYSRATRSRDDAITGGEFCS